jgi:hypothetical protein
VDELEDTNYLSVRHVGHCSGAARPVPVNSRDPILSRTPTQRDHDHTVTAGYGALRRVRRPSSGRLHAMQKWEYLTLWWNRNSSGAMTDFAWQVSGDAKISKRSGPVPGVAIAEELNLQLGDFGLNGWEMVAAVGSTVRFKRPID